MQAPPTAWSVVRDRCVGRLGMCVTAPAAEGSEGPNDHAARVYGVIGGHRGGWPRRLENVTDHRSQFHRATSVHLRVE